MLLFMWVCYPIRLTKSNRFSYISVTMIYQLSDIIPTNRVAFSFFPLLFRFHTLLCNNGFLTDSAIMAEEKRKERDLI